MQAYECCIDYAAACIKTCEKQLALMGDMPVSTDNMPRPGASNKQKGGGKLHDLSNSS